MNKKEPWHAVGEPSAANTLYVCANIVKGLAILLEPFIPASAEAIWKQLGLKGSAGEAGNFEKIKESIEREISRDLKKGARKVYLSFCMLLLEAPYFPLWMRNF